MVNFLLCIICSFGWLLLAGYVGRARRDYLHPAVVFSCLFAISYPLKLILSFYGFHILDSMAVDSTIVMASIVIANGAGLAFVIPLLMLRTVDTSPAAFRLDGFSLYVTLVLAVVLLVSRYGMTAVQAIFSTDDLIARITERGYERTGSGLNALIGEVSTFLLIVFSLKLAGRSIVKNIIPLILMILVSWFALMLSGSKYSALFLPVVVGVAFYYRLRMKKIELLSFHRMVLGLALVLVLIGVTGYIRGYGSWQGEADHKPVVQMFYQLSNAFDAPDNLIVLLDRTESWKNGELGTRLLRDYLILPFIPRAIWPGKPLIQGNQLVMMHYFPERFLDHTGEVISPSFPGEMILTGGIFYMIICSMVLGAGMRWIYRKAQTQGGLYFVAYIWCMLNMFNFLRSGTGMVGSFLLFFIVVVVAQTIVNIISFTTSSITVSRHWQ